MRVKTDLPLQALRPARIAEAATFHPAMEIPNSRQAATSQRGAGEPAPSRARAMSAAVA
jgi:hypothetical protein